VGAGRGEAEGVVAAGEGSADGVGSAVSPAGVDVGGEAAAVAAEGHRVAQVRRLGAGVQVGGGDSHAQRLVAVVLTERLVVEGPGVKE